MLKWNECFCLTFRTFISKFYMTISLLNLGKICYMILNKRGLCCVLGSSHCNRSTLTQISPPPLQHLDLDFMMPAASSSSPTRQSPRSALTSADINVLTSFITAPHRLTTLLAPPPGTTSAPRKGHPRHHGPLPYLFIAAPRRHYCRGEGVTFERRQPHLVMDLLFLLFSASTLILHIFLISILFK